MQLSQNQDQRDLAPYFQYLVDIVYELLFFYRQDKQHHLVLNQKEVPYE